MQLSKTKKYLIVLLALVQLFSCSQVSDMNVNDEIGINGSFEYVKSNYPQRWITYGSPSVAPGDFTVVIDTTEKYEGKQSLKFDVRSCSSTGGRYSPGITQEFSMPAGTYTIRFAIKNNGCNALFKAGGVSATTGTMQILWQSSLVTDWTAYERNVTLSSEFPRLRLEFNVLSPGTLYIDDIEVKAAS